MLGVARAGNEPVSAQTGHFRQWPNKSCDLGAIYANAGGTLGPYSTFDLWSQKPHWCSAASLASEMSADRPPARSDSVRPVRS